MIDVPSGSALETAIGTSDLTALTGNLLKNDITGSDGSSTGTADVALTRYVVTAPVTLPQGTVIVTPTAGEPDTGGAAGFGNVGIRAA